MEGGHEGADGRGGSDGRDRPGGRHRRSPGAGAGPAGFPACRRCPLFTVDRPDVCLACVTRPARPGPAAPGHPTCPVCEQATAADGRCGNGWCARSDRWFSTVWAVAPHTTGLRRAISAYKYGERREWAAVFGRLVAGFLDEHMPWFDDYDAVTAMPVYTGPDGRRTWDHVGLIVDSAARLVGEWWPFERHLVTKTAETPAMAGLGLAGRRSGAEGRLRRVLVVGEPHRVAGRRVLVVDDVFTEGSTLREVARALMLAGAVEVAGLVLDRRPWSATPRRSPP